MTKDRFLPNLPLEFFRSQFAKRSLNCSDGETGKSQPMIIAKELRREVENWFWSLEPNLFVTHNFEFSVSPETGERSLRRFYNRLQSRVHGRNGNRRDAHQPMVAVGVWEHLELQPTLSRADFCFRRRKRVVIWRGQQKLVVAAATRPIRYQRNRSAAEGNFLPHKISYLSTKRRFRSQRTRIQWSRPRTALISAIQAPREHIGPIKARRRG